MISTRSPSTEPERAPERAGPEREPSRACDARLGSRNQLAVQVTVGTAFVPVWEPRNPKVVPAPAARLPL
ncbi:hypothetical protein Cme02nite_54690 [Catellatospora methionotrophica]|uniref:Uncharacterized protein n=1 Tax=Catellatospora methionotrophica TaxID=121620 RepID=A0A8J3LDD1_9ACTN|nr:hypothetical protein Cme02nite_54690 [Catellatospora methionotrophica]